MKIDFVKTLEASSPYTPGRIYFEESTSLIKVATANNQYRVFGGVRSADYDESTQTLTIQNGNGDEVYLDMSEYVKQDSIIYNGNAKIFYGTCSSGGSDTTKIVECEVFTSSELVKGALIFVTFDATNSAAAADILLNVNNTGAKHITKLYNATANPNLNAAGELKANKTYLFGYDGTNWVCLTLDYNTTYSSMTEAEATAGTSTSNRVITPARLKTAITYWMTQNQADWDSSDNTSPKYIANKPDIPTDASVAAWGYLKANDVSTKVDKTDAVSSLSLAMNSSTYTITLSGTMADGSTFTVGNPVDLPLETMVVDGSYNSSTKKVVLGLKNGSSVEFSVADLVAGLQSEITSSNKLSADLIQDGTTNKVVTATDKNNWNSLVSNVQSDWNATTGLAAILNKPDLSLYMTIEDYEEDEEVVAASLNDLNDRILALTSQIPTDASVSGWGYIKTIVDASIAALGYTKNTGTLTGVNFNGVDASVTNGVASIAPYHIDLNGSYLYITLNGSCVLQIVTTYHGQYENGSVTHLINVDVNSDNISVHPICLGDMSCFELSPFVYQSGQFFPVGIRDRRSSGGDLILTIKIYNDGEDPNATKSADITVLGGTPPLSYTMSNTIIQEHDYRWVILSSSVSNIFYSTTDHILYSYDSDGSRKQIFTASSIVSDGGGLTGIKFNGVDASVTNGVASITATIPPDNVFIIPVTKSGTTYSTTVTKSEARAAIDANKLLFVRMAHNRMVMPLRSYDTEDYGDYYFYAVSQYYIYTINLVASGSDGPLSCYYSESALPSAITESTVSGWGFTKNTGTLTGVKFNNTNATINGTVAEITATIPTVNNATLSILKNGTSIGTFTANSSTDTSINIQFNELPIPSTVGPMLVSRYNAQSQVTEWAESTNIFDISNTIHLGNGIPLTAHGSYGDTILATGGILKTNFSDWSWINIQYQENNTTVIKNLQDYLDDSIIFPTASGRIAESYYNSTTQRYEWKASDYYSITSPHVILAQPSGGFSVLKNTTDNPRTAYSLTSSGIVAVNDEGWSWIKYRYNSVITTLQDALDGKQNTLVGSGTGQNIKTVNNNSLVGSGNVSVGTLTGVKFNNVSATINGTVAEITATIPSEVTESTVSSWGFTKNTGTLTSHATHKLTATNNNATSTSGTITFVESLTGTNTATSGDLTITATRKSVTIPSAPGTLKTNNTTAQTASASESLSGTINLHKVAKTGTYSDLIGTPTIPAAANNATITIQKGGTNVDSFTVNASTNKTINIPNELPTVTSTDNGKILEVVNGAWAAASPITVYSGSNAPSNSTGINGDIYIQS